MELINFLDKEAKSKTLCKKTFFWIVIFFINILVFILLIGRGKTLNNDYQRLSTSYDELVKVTEKKLLIDSKKIIENNADDTDPYTNNLYITKWQEAKKTSYASEMIFLTSVMPKEVFLDHFSFRDEEIIFSGHIDGVKNIEALYDFERKLTISKRYQNLKNNYISESENDIGFFLFQFTLDLR